MILTEKHRSALTVGALYTRITDAVNYVKIGQPVTTIAEILQEKVSTVTELYKSRELKYAHPIVARNFLLAREEIEKKNKFRVKPVEVWRSKPYQRKLYAQGRTEPGNVVTWVLISPHTAVVSFAIDFSIWDSSGREIFWDLDTDLDRDDKADYFEAIDIFKKYGFVSGSDWKKQDCPHIEMTFGLNYTQLNRLTLAQALALGKTDEEEWDDMISQKIKLPNGKIITAESLEKDNHVYSPLRSVLEAMGYKVTWMNGIISVKKA